jgi:membrane-associated phospholipid phosphatase
LKNPKSIFYRNSFVYISSVISFIILTAIVFLFPVGFSSYRTTDSFAPIWYVITSTGAVYGGSVIFILLTIYLFTHFTRTARKRKNVFIFTSFIFIVQVLIAGSTLLYFKDVFQNPRPSQLYFVEKGFIGNQGKEFFSMPLEEKSKYMRKIVEENENGFEDIYPPILNSWVYESGYSFPSGHAETGFFLGTILAFVIFKTHSKKYYILIPLAWAILVALSRVVIGVHYPVDVTTGAFIGLSVALFIISMKRINRIFD